MTTYRKLLERVLSGRSDANIRFDDLRTLLTRLGFEERSRESHHVFVKEGVEDMINLQRGDIWQNPIKSGRSGLSSPNMGWHKKETINV